MPLPAQPTVSSTVTWPASRWWSDWGPSELTELIDRAFSVWDARGEQAEVEAEAVHLGRKYHFDERHALHVADVSSSLFDQLADKAVPVVVWPVWILARPAIRALVLAIASGAIEIVLPLTRAAE
jgi:hypothetical protein